MMTGETLSALFTGPPEKQATALVSPEDGHVITFASLEREVFRLAGRLSAGRGPARRPGRSCRFRTGPSSSRSCLRSRRWEPPRHRSTRRIRPTSTPSISAMCSRGCCLSRRVRCRRPGRRPDPRSRSWTSSSPSNSRPAWRSTDMRSSRSRRSTLASPTTLRCSCIRAGRRAGRSRCRCCSAT